MIDPRIKVEALRSSAAELRAQGLFREAGPIVRRCVALSERTFGPESIEFARALNDLGVHCKYVARFAEGERVYARALSIFRRRRASLDLATLYHNLGGLEHARGRFASGVPLARRSVAIRTRVLGPGHPDVAADMAALAALLDGQRKYAESEPLYRRVITIFERAYGRVNYDVAVNLNNLAAVRSALGRTAEARRLYHRSLRIKQRLLGADHPDVAITLNNLGVLEKSCGRAAMARTLFRRAYKIFARTFGARHPSAKATATHLAGSI